MQTERALRACDRIRVRFPRLSEQLQTGISIGSPEHKADGDLIALNNYACGMATAQEIARALQVMTREGV